MHLKFNLGSIHAFVPLVMLVLLIAVFLSPVKRNIFSSFHHTTSKIGINLNNIYSEKYVSWINNQQDDFAPYEKVTFLNKNVTFKDIALNPNSAVLGAIPNYEGERWIEVDISDQRLYMKEGFTTVGTFAVSTGKWYPTPVGEWNIWIKLRYTRMRGGSKAFGTYYDLPNVPYTMYYDRGYGVHGAYWHNNFGQPMSHGCVNMRPEEAGVVFNWASQGTRVVVHH